MYICSVSKSIQVPNVTRKKVHYRVESDLPFISGRENVSVLPGKSADYELTVSPRRRGTYKGVISFVADRNPVRYVSLLFSYNQPLQLKVNVLYRI